MDEIIDLHSADPEAHREAAQVLTEAFLAKNNRSWETLSEATKEVNDCLNSEYMCYALTRDGRIAGWIGMRPMYADHTWELHPLVVHPRYQRTGVGRKLLDFAERRASQRGISGIVLGTDDQTNSTSLSEYDFDTGTISEAIDSIENRKHHPYEFYERFGYRIVGIIPDANGPGEPDILMWKRLSNLT